MNHELGIVSKQLPDFCASRGIRKLSCFGSAVRGELGPESDVDLLVEFEPGTVVGLNIIDIEDELSKLFGGRKVDLVSEKYLNRRLRERVLAEAEVLYESSPSWGLAAPGENEN